MRHFRQQRLHTRNSVPSATIVIDPAVKSIYRYVDKKTYLNWGLTSDWLVSGPRERRSVKLYTEDESQKSVKFSRNCDFETDSEDDNSASEGYGEMTAGSIEKLFIFLRGLDIENLVGVELPPSLSTPNKNLKDCIHHNHSKYRMIPGQSTFIDIGSGYGKVVFHAKISADVSRSVGIEYVPARAQMAVKIQKDLIGNEMKDIGILDDIAKTKLHDCSLYEGDATAWKSFEYSHVYMYDRVFSKNTLLLLAKKLNQSSYSVLISYRRLEEWKKLGLKSIQLVRSITMRTTGGQNFKAYIFIRE